MNTRSKFSSGKVWYFYFNVDNLGSWDLLCQHKNTFFIYSLQIKKLIKYGLFMRSICRSIRLQDFSIIQKLRKLKMLMLVIPYYSCYNEIHFKLWCAFGIIQLFIYYYSWLNINQFTPFHNFQLVLFYLVNRFKNEKRISLRIFYCSYTYLQGAAGVGHTQKKI